MDYGISSEDIAGANASDALGKTDILAEAVFYLLCDKRSIARDKHLAKAIDTKFWQLELANRYRESNGS